MMTTFVIINKMQIKKQNAIEKKKKIIELINADEKRFYTILSGNVSGQVLQTILAL